MGALLHIIVILSVCGLAVPQVLTPEYFNLAVNRTITASSTCGVDVEEPELYCKLVGANSDKISRASIIQGQICDYCDGNDERLRHPPKYAIDGLESWWQSPPLSRGMGYNEVNLTIDLGQLFQVAYVIVKMGNSPRPGVWSLERSVDNGKTFQAWQNFADSKSDCQRYFGEDSIQKIVNDNDVICATHLSKVVPLEGGEMVVSLLNGRPSATKFFNSTDLQEFTRATNIRLRLLRTKTLLGHLMSVVRQDSTVTRRYFYSIKDISIGGRCVCNGHASVCIPEDVDDDILHRLKCRCEHHTCGSECQSCCPGYIQKQWQSASYSKEFVCEECNCHGHSHECIFDEEVNRLRQSLDIHGFYDGGGVCQNCQRNTKGINCHECQDTFFRSYGRTTNDSCDPCNCYGHAYTGNCAQGDGQCECKPAFLPPYCDACNEGYYDFPTCKLCDCHRVGTDEGVCEVGGAQCPCKDSYTGLNCDQCAEGFYGFPECMPCDCVEQGSLHNVCDAETGQCACHNNYGGQQCERCGYGYFDYDYQNCTFCNCDSRGTEMEVCNNRTGECICYEGYSGDRCDNSAPGFWGYPLVRECSCHEIGSSSLVCDSTGKCGCIFGYSGKGCGQCSPGFYNFPNCEPCECDHAGSIGVSCDSEGICQCESNFDGVKCDKCRDMFYNFPLCEECNCDPAGVLPTFAGCGNAPVGELCECKERVTGRICNKCKSLFWNLEQYNPQGCEDCACYMPGTMGNLQTCENDGGQCNCKPGVTSRQCNQCIPGTYNQMEDNLFGCIDCQCNIGGSVSNVCNPDSGQCPCRHRVQGQKCDRPMQAHYLPTLYHLKYEAEDGRTPHNTEVRYGYDERLYPNYSWKGYAVYSELQKETLLDVSIVKPSLYRMIINYHNPGPVTTKGTITITPENPSDDVQSSEAHFHPTSSPTLMTLSLQNAFPIPLVMNPGIWTVSIHSTESIFVDYFVLLPVAYYEPSLLTEHVRIPCHVEDADEPCLQFSYPDMTRFDLAYAIDGFMTTTGYREPVDIIYNNQVYTDMSNNGFAWLSPNQPEFSLDLHMARPGLYYLVVNYLTPNSSHATNIELMTKSGGIDQSGQAVLYDCTYSFVCSQVVTNHYGEIATFNFEMNAANIVFKLQGEDTVGQTIHSIVAVPVEEWSMDYVSPQKMCTRSSPAGNCVETAYIHPADSIKVEFESNYDGTGAPSTLDNVSNTTVLVHLNETTPMVEIQGKVRSPGRYAFIVHYFQPNNPAHRIEGLLQNGQFYQSYLDVEHCPNTAGCRTTLKQMDGLPLFDIVENFYLTLKRSGSNDVHLDYVMAVPEEHFSPRLIRELPVDTSANFFKECGQNNFFIDPAETGYCREAAFALTSEYNNGALQCQCNIEGSISLECQTFGGQCQCRANVIGRDCSACRTGYYGFPNCRPCNCPSTALCGPIHGECICPPNVVGERCEHCAQNTYGFDPIIGCEDCQCDPNGVQGREMQCNLNTGKCPCNDHVVERRCDQCAAGYWSFPFCQLCNCDLRGTEDDICNQHDATCFCKNNIHGRSCDQCVRGSFHLEESNPDGCTKCFCFGKTKSCESSNRFWKESMFGVSWNSVYLLISEGLAFIEDIPEELSVYNDLVLMNLTSHLNPVENGYAYFGASHLGNGIQSYGGYLSFKVYTVFSQHENEEDIGFSGDLVIRGNGITALYFLPMPLTSGVTEAKVHLVERSFKTLAGVPLRRGQFMTILHSIDGLYVRSQYGIYSSETRLSEVRISEITTDHNYVNFPAMSVEQCQCPGQYTGTSCEECADGYYRAETGPYGGYCVPCQCNEHANVCDKVSGKCLNCQDNTIGDHCEDCNAGYLGDATEGTIYDCLICSCPLPSLSNNFALSCLENTQGYIECECQTGYDGQTCGLCAPGYYGEPRILGKSCNSCECNNNIDVNSPFACDDISGLCLSCLNNTFGQHCERCAPWFFGDAIDAKNCAECTCDECGTRNCHHYTGVCECHENVVGTKCDQCQDDFWGFAHCQGCHECSCDVASESTQCDLETGQCHCMTGVAGQRCDRCKPGFWDYSETGCKECTCRGGFSRGVGCDPITGQCSCLTGVIGANCDSCPHRWALIEGYGCRECDDCIHGLLDTTDQLNDLIYPVIGEYASAAQSFFLHQRLQLINSSVEDLSPKVDSLNINDDDLRPVREALDNLQKDALDISAKGNLLRSRAISSSFDGLAVHVQSDEVLQSIYKGKQFSMGVIEEVNLLVIGLETGEGGKIEQAINQAEYILSEMNAINFTAQNDGVQEDLEFAEEYLAYVTNYSYPVMNNQDNLEAAVSRLRDLDEKIDEMRDYIDQARTQSRDVYEMNRKSKIYGLASLDAKFNEISHMSDVSMKQNDESEVFIKEAEEKLNKARHGFDILGSHIEEMRAANEQLNNSVSDTALELNDLRNPALEAADHSHQLKETAERLDGMLVETRHVTENALAAANAYDNIVTAIDDAHDAAIAASNASDKAVNLSNGINDNSLESLHSSEGIHALADSKTTMVQDVLLPQLNRAQLDVATLEHMTGYQKNLIEVMKSKLEVIPKRDLSNAAEHLQVEAAGAEKEVRDLYNSINNRYENLQQHAHDARELSQNLDEHQRDSKLAHTQIENIEAIVPGMQRSAEQLVQQKDRILSHLQDVGSRLERLRRTISNTREQTNKIKVGIDFQSGSVVELKNPEDLSDTATDTELLVHIRTTEQDGLPLFLGTPVGGSSNLRRTSTDDFMAIELEDGYVKLTTNLGAGPHHVNNEVYVADGQWHKILVKRIGKVVRLTVSSETKQDGITEVTSQSVLPGTYSILNLDPKVSKLYVGGIPAGIEVDPKLSSTNYIGQVEDLWINGKPIGLWNFVEKGAGDADLRGAKERIILRGSPSDSHVLRLSGSGFVAMETKGRDVSPTLSLILSFKTFAEDGLLFMLVSRMKEFVSLELRNGHVVYQHNFGSGVTVLTSDKKYNDNDWHVIEATRVDGDALLQIDQRSTKQGKSQGYRTDFTSVPDVMYFGGFPEEHTIPQVTNVKYRGCIRDVSVSRLSVDFLRAQESVGTVPGCKEEVVSLVSFLRDRPGYIYLPSPHDISLQLVFKFKTSNPNGLLFYTETKDKAIYLSLSMAEGALVLRSAPGGEISTGSYTQYNDSTWHIVIATRENNELRLDIDDFEKYSVQLIQESIPFDGPAFFGGLPDMYAVAPAASAVDTNFVGCIGDATLNGKIINFEASTERPYAIMDSCDLMRVIRPDYFPDHEVDLPDHYSERPGLEPSSRPVGGDEDISYPSPVPFFTFGPEDESTEGHIESDVTTAPPDRCALPVQPEEDRDIRPENGARFGNKRDTRIEYEELPDNLRADFVFSVDFRTFADEGIIFYASSMNHRDYVTMYMSDGKIVFSFSAGSAPATMRSQQKYNDDQWHKLVAQQSSGVGRLEIDGYIVANGSMSGSARHIEHEPPYYYGGLDTNIIALARDNTDQTDLSFNGCLRGFRMNNKIVGGKRSINGVSDCSYKVESGVFFGEGQKSHIVAQRRFSVGMTFELTLEVKPRLNSGVLMSVHGRKDFILLQLRDGIVEAKMENGKGVVTAQFNTTGVFGICDGRWHKVHLVKNKHVLILVVDEINSPPGVGALGTSSCDTNSPFFLGSQPRITKRRGGAVQQKYVGCMRNVNLNQNKLDLNYALFVGNVNAGVCPLN